MRFGYPPQDINGSDLFPLGSTNKQLCEKRTLHVDIKIWTMGITYYK